MRKNLIGFCLILGFFFLFAQGQATCPEQSLDAGVCDTLSVNVHPPDVETTGDPYYLVRFPIRITHELAYDTDSISGFIIPLCYTHTNTSAYCSLTTWWNTTTLNPYDPAMSRSIFRDLDVEDNWFQDLMWPYFFPPSVFLNLDGTSHFWLSYIPELESDRRMPDVSRGLLATMAFRVSDSTTICIDSCLWPTSNHLAFINSMGQSYVPRDNMPVCENVGMDSYSPPVLTCPDPQLCNKNGSFSADVYIDVVEGVTIENAWCCFTGNGVGNVTASLLGGPFSFVIRVAYDVLNHCGTGGVLKITVEDNFGYLNFCEFNIVLGNDPPQVNVPDVLNTASDCGTRGFLASASDPNDDLIVSFTMDAFWCQDDSPRVPTVAPNFEGTNPGEFWWNPGEGDQGSWIALFSAEEECGLTNSKQVLVEVGSVCCGDVNGDGNTNLGDAIKLLDFLFKGGDPPEPLCKGNVNCDSTVSLSDVLHLLNMLFRGGPECCFDCCS